MEEQQNRDHYKHWRRWGTTMLVLLVLCLLCGVDSRTPLQSSRRLFPSMHHQQHYDKHPAMFLSRGGARSKNQKEEEQEEEEDSLLVEQDDKEESFLVTKIRNVVRNLVHVCNAKLPWCAPLLRSTVRLVEQLTGLSLLPVIQKPKKTSKSSKSTAKEATNDVASSKKKTSKSTTANNKHLTTIMDAKSPLARIQKELKDFVEHPPDNLAVRVGTNLRIWIVTIKGATGSIYEGETFALRIQFPRQYPLVPPSVYFLPGKMPKHEHVYTNGDICLSLLGNGWKPTMTAQSIAVSILSMLSSAKSKRLPMDNARHATAKPGQYQKDWVYHDDSC